MLKYLIPLVLLLHQLCLANMASPVREGTHAISAVSSKDMDVLNENLYIKTDRFFRTARYRVEYTIRNEKGGLQIPLLFHARDCLGEFRVWLDGKPVELKEIPRDLKETSPKLDFFTAFKKGENERYKSILIRESYSSGRFFPLSDFRYFEVDLPPGKHQIQVEYLGRVWIDEDDWTKEYSFRYFLSPAKEWKSFHALNIRVDASAFDRNIRTNLGLPDSGTLQNGASWHFSKIPADYVYVSYQPPVNNSAEMLIAISPWGMTAIFGVIVFLVHALLVRFTRKRKWNRLTSFLVIAGSVILPFVILTGYGYSYDLIDYTIGSEAGRYHGYTFFSVFLYVFLMPAYWFGMNRVSVYFRNRFAAKS